MAATISCPCPGCDCSICSLSDLPFSPSPCFAELATSNEPPNDRERAAISDETEQLRSQIAELDNRISRTEASLKQLQAAKDALQEQLTARSSILSLIRTLPTDILCEIYTRTISTTYTFTDTAPWLIAAVSRRWRTAATAFAQLWSHIYILLDSDPKLNDGQQLYDRIALQIQRSRQHPLSLYLELETSFREFPYLVRVLSETSHRWRLLFLSGYYLSSFHPLLTQELPLPLLQAMLIDLYSNEPSATTSQTKYPFFRQASSLTKLTIPLYLLAQFEWLASSTTLCDISFVYGSFPNLTARKVIRQFTGLKVLTYRPHLGFTPVPEEPPETPLTMSNLTKLNIDFYIDFDRADPFLEALEAPNLTDLCLRGILKETVLSYALSYVLSLRARSDFKLSKLALDDRLLIQTEIVLSLLEAFPTIRELSLESDSTTRILEVEALLGRLAQETTIAPNLRVLNLHTFFEQFSPSLANARPDLRVDFY